MTTLTDRFNAALDDLHLPETDLVDAVIAAIEPEVDQVRSPRRRWLIGTIAACVVAASVLIAPVRAVGQWLGIGATEIRVEPTVETSDPATAPQELLGIETLGGDPADVALNPLPQFGEPAAVLDHRAVRARSFVWAASADNPALGESEIGVVLYVRPTAGAIDAKRLPLEDVVAETVAIVTPNQVVSGFWIDGPHTSTRAGSDRQLLADRVLLWAIDGVQYRLEADRGRAEMIEIAQNIEGGTNLLPPG